MPAGETSYPDQLDDATNLPALDGYRADGTSVDDGTFNAHARQVAFLAVLAGAARALEAKVGRGGSTPVTGRVLRGTAAGVSEWTAVAQLAADAFGPGAGTPGQVLAVDDAGTGLEFTDDLADALDAAVATLSAALAAHAAAATDVHGVDDGTIESTTGAQGRVDAHSSDTTAVHGIADTAALVLTTDGRLDDERVPPDGSVTIAKLAFDPATQTELTTHAAAAGADGHIAQQAAITNAVVAVGDPPTKAEFDAVVGKLNAVLAALRSAGVIAT